MFNEEEQQAKWTRDVQRRANGDVRDVMDRCGMQRWWLARKMQVSEKTLCRWYIGDTCPTYWQYLKLMELAEGGSRVG